MNLYFNVYNKFKKDTKFNKSDANNLCVGDEAEYVLCKLTNTTKIKYKTL